jgi:hypothetical protein
MYEPDNISSRTDKFFQDVIEHTISTLSWSFSENGLSEDLLDRLKASWEKTLRDKQISNMEEANRRITEQQTLALHQQ